jgi:hypothetical protein
MVQHIVFIFSLFTYIFILRLIICMLAWFYTHKPPMPSSFLMNTAAWELPRLTVSARLRSWWSHVVLQISLDLHRQFQSQGPSPESTGRIGLGCLFYERILFEPYFLLHNYL